VLRQVFPAQHPMAFDAAALADKLRKLSPSAQSVEQLSAWCLFHWRSAKEVATTWAQCLSQAPDKQKLAFVYLANDVVQNSRKRGPHYVDAFAPLLPGALRHVLKHSGGGADTLRQLHRMVAVWEERRVFGTGKAIQQLKAAVEDTQSAAQTDDGAAATASGDAETSLQAVMAADRALRAASSDSVRAARLALIQALRNAADVQEALLATTPAGQDSAPAAVDEQEYDPGDALIIGSSAAPTHTTAAVLDSFLHLSAEQREAVAAALAVAAQAAAHAEQQQHGAPQAPPPLMHAPSLGAWAAKTHVDEGANEEIVTAAVAAGADDGGEVNGHKRKRDEDGTAEPGPNHEDGAAVE
jgi:CID domain